MQSGSLPESEAEEEDEVANCLQDNHFTQSGSPTDSEVVLLSAQENATLDHLASDVYDRIIKGFNKIRDLMKEPESQLLAVSTSGVKAQLHKSDRESVVHRAPELLRQADTIASAGRLKSWCLKYLAGAILSYYRSLPASENDDLPELDIPTHNTLNSWAIVADMTNCIVNGLHSTWEDKTYLVFSALACKSPSPKHHRYWI